MSWLAPLCVVLAVAQDAPRVPDNVALLATYQAAQKRHLAGELVPARAEMEAVLASDPKNLDLALTIARWLAEVRGDFVGALPFAKRAQELGLAKQDSINLVGSVLTMNGQAIESEKLFASGTARFPTEPLMWYGLGVARNQQMKYLEAKAAFGEALRLAPEDGLAHFSVGETHANLREFTDAEREFALAAKLEGHDDALWRLGETLSREGKDAPAEQILRQALQKGSKSSRFHAALQLAMFLVEHGRCEEALPLLIQATDQKPTSRDAWRWLARAQRSLGKPEAAARSMKRCQELRAEEDRAEEERLLGLIKAQLQGARDAAKEGVKGG
jgi:tetratricopeptide (TPR) repeat protein